MRTPPVVPRPIFQPDSPRPSSSWLDRASVWQLRLLAALSTLLLFLVNFATDRLLLREWRQPIRMIIVSNGVAAIIIGFLLFKLAEYAHERRRRLSARLRMISDLNHHIRNALETIALSAYTTKNQQPMATISGAVNRIDWALREILPTAEN